MKACFILVTLRLRALKRKNAFSPVFGTQYRNFLPSSSLTTLRKTGQQNEGVEFRKEPETPQAVPLRPEAGGGTGVTPGQAANPEHAGTPGAQRGGPERFPQAPEAKVDGKRAPPPPPAPRPHREPGAPGRRCRPYFPHSSQLPPTWRRPWPPGAGPGWRRAAGRGGRCAARAEGAGPRSGLGRRTRPRPHRRSAGGG